jgi:hypothetical protein
MSINWGFKSNWFENFAHIPEIITRKDDVSEGDSFPFFNIQVGEKN